MKNDHLKELLKAIELDASYTNANDNNIRKVFCKLYSERQKVENVKLSMQKASELMSINNKLLNSLKESERLENKIFKVTSNAALISTIGAALTASALPAAVLPAAMIAGFAAIGGYVSKLKFEHDAIEGAKKLLEQASSDSVLIKG